MDVSSDGMLTLPEFRSVLKLCNGKIEFFFVLKIYYSRFLGSTKQKEQKAVYSLQCYFASTLPVIYRYIGISWASIE